MSAPVGRCSCRSQDTPQAIAAELGYRDESGARKAVDRLRSRRGGSERLLAYRAATSWTDLDAAAAPFAPSVLSQGPLALGRGGTGPPAEKVASSVQREAVAVLPGAQHDASEDTAIT